MKSAYGRVEKRQVTGVTFSPWWDNPQSIVAESVGALTRKRPAEARRRGYVWGNGLYRQKPGPTNALGRMKLAMANPYSVYLHDTPNKALFDKTTRAFSHGCIRVGDALGFAATLLAGNVPQARLDAILASNQTTEVPLDRSIPVYVVYFTVDISGDGSLTFYKDHYGRDKIMGDAKNPVLNCPA
jgi:murein L,D-transpeptidase YcbB/YkuD